MLQSCGKHHLQGVWGAARHDSPLGGGEREEPSPLAFAKQDIMRLEAAAIVRMSVSSYCI